MPTIKEFQKWLSQFPEDTEVEFAFQEPSSGYESYGPVGFKSPELKFAPESNELQYADFGDGVEYNDWSKNKFVKPDAPYFGKRYLFLGESN